MQKVLFFMFISLVRYLVRKGTVDMNDFVDSSLRFLEEGEVKMTKDEKEQLMKFIVGLPRRADP